MKIPKVKYLEIRSLITDNENCLGRNRWSTFAEYFSENISISKKPIIGNTRPMSLAN